MKYEKLIKDGKVAVLYSPGYGAGISTWSRDNSEALVFDKELIEPVLNGDIPSAVELCEKKYPQTYTGGFRDAKIEWVPIGTAFRITEYDGFESIEEIGMIDHYIA